MMDMLASNIGNKNSMTAYESYVVICIRRTHAKAPRALVLKKTVKIYRQILPVYLFFLSNRFCLYTAVEGALGYVGRIKT